MLPLETVSDLPVPFAVGDRRDPQLRVGIIDRDDGVTAEPQFARWLDHWRTRPVREQQPPGHLAASGDGGGVHGQSQVQCIEGLLPGHALRLDDGRWCASRRSRIAPRIAVRARDLVGRIGVRFAGLDRGVLELFCPLDGSGGRGLARVLAAAGHPEQEDETDRDHATVRHGGLSTSMTVRRARTGAGSVSSKGLHTVHATTPWWRSRGELSNSPTNPSLPLGRSGRSERARRTASCRRATGWPAIETRVTPRQVRHLALHHVPWTACFRPGPPSWSPMQRWIVVTIVTAGAFDAVQRPARSPGRSRPPGSSADVGHGSLPA